MSELVRLGVTPRRPTRISLAVVAHERGRAALVADDRDLATRGRGDHRGRSSPAGKAAGGLVQAPESVRRERLRLLCADGRARRGVVVVDGDGGAGETGVHDPLTGVPWVRARVLDQGQVNAGAECVV